MRYLFVFIAIIISFSFYSCSTSRDEMSAKIFKMESAVESSPEIDTVAAAELLSAYQNYSAKYPDDSLSPEYLYKAAGLAVALNRGLQAVILYESINHNYPGYRKNPECLFMEAFTYENTLGNIGKAKELYNVFLARYPDHELADDARIAIKFLGKSPEEIVSEFDKMRVDSVK
jgi:hypothetical protein